MVLGNGDDTGPDDIELSGLDRDFIQQDGCDDDPGNRPQPVCKAKTGRAGSHRDRHVIEKDCNRQSNQGGIYSRDVAF